MNFYRKKHISLQHEGANRTYETNGNFFSFLFVYSEIIVIFAAESRKANNLYDYEKERFPLCSYRCTGLRLFV